MNTSSNPLPPRRAASGLGRLSILALFLGSAALCGIAQAAPTGTLTTLHAFAGSDGATPYASLTLDGSGNLYGTASTGGANNAGAVFEISTGGAYKTLYSFTYGNDGGNPNAALLLGSDGNFYGTARDGSPDDAGTVFSITPAGVLTTLYTFTGKTDGGEPTAALIASGGNFYGTTASGGDDGVPSTVFEITPAGALTTLHTFAHGADGSTPYGALLQGTDGNFYGTTSAAGANDAGTVFRITPAGVLTTLYTFTGGSDGAAPEGGLILGGDGNFYGTTSSGQDFSNNHGSVFRITPAGVLTTLYSFTGGNDGDAPEAALIKGSDGNFYGTTAYGGADNVGTVFQVTPAGVLTTLYSFVGTTDGKLPFAALIQGSDGSFYGTTAAGGPNGDGTVFKLTVASSGTSTASSGPSGNSAPASDSGSGTGGSASGGGSFSLLMLAALGMLLLARQFKPLRP